MSVDGRGGAREDGDAQADGLATPQVPAQGGRTDLSPGSGPASGEGAGPTQTGPTSPQDGPPASAEGRVPAPEGSTGQASAEGTVPAQRDRREDGALPPQEVPPQGLPAQELPAQELPPHTRPPLFVELPPADLDLIDRMRAGDDTAYEELYRRHSGAVRRYARTCCRDAHTADDLTAEVFARMLQAVRGGAGPGYAVRAYLLTSVRRVAANWTRSARREQLVDDFALFAAGAARTSDMSDDDTLELGADVRALHEAEQSMAMQAFRSLPERWQAVLWHTEVENESPSQVAVLFGLDANGTRVLASRAREGLKQAYLQAHVSTALAGDEECARYTDQLGTYARRKLRTRAERGLRKHLEECARCRLAATQIEEVASGIPAVVPLAVLGWFGAAGYAKALGLIAGGAGAAGAAAAGGAAAGGGAAATAAAGGGSSGGAGAGAAASEALGAPVKAGIAAGVVAVAAAAVALALVGQDSPAKKPEAAVRPSSAPAVEPEPSVTPAPSKKPPAAKPVVLVPTPAPLPVPAAEPKPTLSPASPARPAPAPAPTRQEPEPAQEPEQPPAPTPTPPPPPAVYQWSELPYDVAGDGTAPEMRLGESSWVWQRSGLSIAGKRYTTGVSVHGSSSVTIDLNRACSAYDALIGVDDRALGLGAVRFSVYADEVRLWKSGTVRGGEPAVPVHVDLSGRHTVRLVVEPRGPLGSVAPADWAESRFTCS
ncbi:sigma-70 family RNA polymerase sigma factor [Streptomyces sp. NPDC059378]|uniref:sigma-70 family RNA polymerase sigma factor n=1 Tax=Streptomyces sp. NPDC059378 TaxID=3346815 RepID=UPI00369A0EC3